jgi:diguanylate cyclase (GGDEF)-like protein
MARSLSYALAGGILSAGAPLGLLAVRFALVPADSPWPQRIASVVFDDLASYVYTATSTAIAFSLFGYLLGRQADRLADLSETDALTGLCNARGLSNRLGTALARVNRYREPLALLLVDVDGLKRINDRDGHAAGDAALRAVAEAIQTALRESDAAARWGGDEFAILALNISRPSALALAERIRALIARPRAPCCLTGSLGVVSVEPTEGSRRIDAATLMRTADAALYEAKRHGGNTVAILDAAQPDPRS